MSTADVGTHVQPLILDRGSHLFVDDFLIADSRGVTRQVVPPERILDGPVITSGPEHRNWQCWVTVLPSDNHGSYRMWYDAHSDEPRDRFDVTDLAYLESHDPLNWPGPYRTCDGPRPHLFGANVLDEGPGFHTPRERFKLVYFPNSEPHTPDREGLRAAHSPDGLRWTKYNNGAPLISFGTPADSLHAWYDLYRRRYALIAKIMKPYTWASVEGRRITADVRRYAITWSDDFRAWTEPEIVFAPDQRDSGITEWYGAAGFLPRGGLTLAFLQELRDSLTVEGAPPEAIACNKGNPGAGTGYTVLAWTRDGRTWERDRFTDKYLAPDPRVGAWDHAMAWIDCALEVGDDVLLYYAGYRWGHKFNMLTDRQLGVARTRRDRFVARVASPAGGSFRTPVLTRDRSSLTLNADASRGEIRVQATDAEGRSLAGLAFADALPITADALRSPLRWRNGRALPANTLFRLEFAMTDADLFALNVEAPTPEQA
jgi:hypothetical protein